MSISNDSQICIVSVEQFQLKSDLLIKFNHIIENRARLHEIATDEQIFGCKPFQNESNTDNI